MRDLKNWLNGWDQKQPGCRGRHSASKRTGRVCGAKAELGEFLGLSRFALDRFLNEHGVELTYSWEDLERERKVHRELSGT